MLMKNVILMNSKADAATTIVQDTTKDITIQMTLHMDLADSDVNLRAVPFIHVGTAILLATRDVTMATELEETDAQCIVSMLKKAGNVQSTENLVSLSLVEMVILSKVRSAMIRTILMGTDVPMTAWS